MKVAGIDLSTHAIDLVLLDLDTDQAVWRHYDLQAGDLIDRVMSIRQVLPHPRAVHWDGVLAIGLERPAGRWSVDKVAMVFGAVLAGLPPQKLVKPWMPAEWRKACGMKGNATKEEVYLWAAERWPNNTTMAARPQDALDAYCIAYATRQALEPAQEAA